MANHDASDILATALKEMDDIIKSCFSNSTSNDVMISEMKAQSATSGTFSPATERRFANSSPGDRRPSQNSLGSNGPSNSGSFSIDAPTSDVERSPRGRPSGAGGQEDKALALLSELKSCMTEVSGVREVFRDLSSENQVFLRQLVGEIGSTDTGTMKSSSSVASSTSTKATSLHSLTTPMSGKQDAEKEASESPVPSRPTMGTAGTIQRAVLLEEEKRNLIDQVNILREQVDNQNEKIKELERNNKQTNVSHKLDMMAEISQQRVRIVTLEREKKELEDLLNDHKRQINDLRLQVLRQEKELLLAKSALGGSKIANGKRLVALTKSMPGTPLSKSINESAAEIKMKMLNDPMTRSMPDPTASSTPLQITQAEDNKTPPIVKSKPLQPQNLGKILNQYPAFDPMIQSAYAGTSPTEEEAAAEALPEETSSLSQQKSSSLGELPTQQVARPVKPPPPLTYASKTPPTRHRNAVVMPTSNGHAIDPKYASLGRGQLHAFGSSNDDDDLLGHEGGVEKKRSFRRFFGSRGHHLDHSGQDECPFLVYDYGSLGELSSTFAPKRGSQDIDPGDMFDDLASLKLGSGNFQRFGVRATAGPRLGLKWNMALKSEEFAQWDCDQVCAWLHEMGLGQYVIACRRWIRHGAQLLQASRKDMEKELGLRSSLHLKKLVLAVDAMRRPSGPMRGLSFSPGFSATRWLDDIGLPQYKTAFASASLDARVLNSLTWEDLHNLKINVELHCLSLKRGIQVLRKIDFNLDRLRRRPNETTTSPPPEEVCLWSNHQVMEWLRHIDFPEFASNLRGSGIHGALMVLEPRFNAEVLAALLNIPASKTLLRRHLSTHFASLIGTEVQQRKRDAEAHYEQLTPYSKIKASRRKPSFFTKRGRAIGNGTSADDDELLCPLGDDVNGIDLRKIQALTAEPKEMIETNIDDLSNMTRSVYGRRI